MKRAKEIIALAISLFALQGVNAQEANAQDTKAQEANESQMPAWKDGYLDIHHIATGRGDATLVVMPDGTRMLIDAGDMGTAWHIPLPNDSLKTAGEWMAKYIKDFSEGLPSAPDEVDYFWLTHFHADHYGCVHASTIDPLGKGTKGWRLAGITKVGEYIKFDKIIDRDCPDWNFPSREYILKHGGNFFNDYMKYCLYQQEHNGTILEKFQVGSRKQFAPRYHKVPDFEVFNMISNGYISTGCGLGKRKLYLDEDLHIIDENVWSSGIKIQYGKFSYYTCGDLAEGPDQSRKAKKRDFASDVADLCGHVTVMRPNHHGYWDSASGYCLRKLSPEAIVIHCSSRNHPVYKALDRMTDWTSYEGERQLYITTQGSRERLGEERWQNFVQHYGHIVVRVYEKGESYQIYVLDANHSGYKVLYRSGIKEL